MRESSSVSPPCPLLTAVALCGMALSARLRRLAEFNPSILHPPSTLEPAEKKGMVSYLPLCKTVIMRGLKDKDMAVRTRARARTHTHEGTKGFRHTSTHTHEDETLC